MRASYAGRAAGMNAAYPSDIESSLGTTRIVLALKKRGNLASPPPGAEACAPASSQLSGWAAGSADPPSDAGSRSATSATTGNPTLMVAPTSTAAEAETF